MLKILTEVLSTAAPTLPVLEVTEEVLNQEVRPGYESSASPGAVRQSDGMAPERRTMAGQVRQQDVDGFAGVMSWSSRWKAIQEGRCEQVELLVHLVEVIGGLVLWWQGGQPQDASQLVEQAGAST